jgi:Fe-S oxidoreductase
LDHIVVPCASCAEQLKHGFVALCKEPEENLHRARAFSARVSELSDFLYRHGAADRGEAGQRSDSQKRAVTYHDPCHLARGLGIREAPRALLRSLKSWQFREMDKADQCCGLGGSFRLSNPEIAAKVLSEKLEAVEQSGAQAVVTGCMGCWMHLQEGICNAGLDVEVLHPAEILKREQDEDSP